MDKNELLAELNELLDNYDNSPEDFITDDGEQTQMWQEREDHFWAICQGLPSWKERDDIYVDENCADPDTIICKFIEHINAI